MTKYSYERPFRMKILALLLDRNWLIEYGMMLIRPEYFEMADEEAIAKSIIEYYQTYEKPPEDADDVIALLPVEYASVVYALYDIYDAGELQLARDTAIRFAKEQALKLALLDSVDDVEHGNFDNIEERFREARKVGENISSSGIDPVADVDKWLYDYWSDKVRTGMYHLDKVLDGGLSVGELGVILGPPNRGKSMALIGIGYGAASIGSGKNVVHFSHEMKIEQVAKRYAARMTFRFPMRDENVSDYEDTLIEVARRFVQGNIRIIGGHRMTFDEIEMHLSRLQDDGFDIGLIIDDYPDLMAARKAYNDKRFELSSIFEDWREIGNRYNVPVWAASQATRASLSKEIITMADVAEDIGKAAIADVIVAICQTYEEKQADQARLFLAKQRDGGTKTPLIACKWYNESQAIITTGFVTHKDKEQDA